MVREPAAALDAETRSFLRCVMQEGLSPVKLTAFSWACSLGASILWAYATGGETLPVLFALYVFAGGPVLLCVCERRWLR